jgi:hypothetical protein
LGGAVAPVNDGHLLTSTHGRPLLWLERRLQQLLLRLRLRHRLQRRLRLVAAIWRLLLPVLLLLQVGRRTISAGVAVRRRLLLGQTTTIVGAGGGVLLRLLGLRLTIVLLRLLRASPGVGGLLVGLLRQARASIVLLLGLHGLRAVRAPWVHGREVLHHAEACGKGGIRT